MIAAPPKGAHKGSLYMDAGRGVIAFERLQRTAVGYSIFEDFITTAFIIIRDRFPVAAVRIVI